MGPILLLAIVGIAAGFIATKIMKTPLSLLETIAVGLLGAVVGGLILRALMMISGVALGLVGAVAGACLMIWLYLRIFGARR